MVWCLASICQLFPLKVYYSRTAQQNVTPRARGAEPNRGKKGTGIFFKDYSSRTAQQNVTKFGVKHHLGKGNQFCINDGAGPPEAKGVRPNRGNKGISFKDYSSRMTHQNVTDFDVKHPWVKGRR